MIDCKKADRQFFVDLDNGVQYFPILQSSETPLLHFFQRSLEKILEAVLKVFD